MVIARLSGMIRCVFATVSLLPGVLRFVVNDLFAVDCFTCKETNGVRLQFPPRQKSQDDDQIDLGHTDSQVGSSTIKGTGRIE